MKPLLNVGDWATIAFFALAVVLGCYAQAEPKARAASPASTTTAHRSDSAKTALAAVGLE